MTDHADIIEFIDSIFDTVDAKDWDAAEQLLAVNVVVDFTSLTGGDPATVSNVALVDGWRQGLHRGKQSFHLVGHCRIRADGDFAEVTVKGYAYNVLAEELGGGMWEVWGDYDIPVRRGGSGWQATGMTFRAWHSRGDESVRTHLLSS